MKKQELERYRIGVMELRQLEQAREEIASGVVCSSVCTGMPRGSGISNKTECIAIKLVDIDEEIRLRLNSLMALWLEIETGIGVLEPMERILIRARYVEGKTWTKVAETIRVRKRIKDSKTSTSRANILHKRAIAKLDAQELINGREYTAM